MKLKRYYWGVVIPPIAKFYNISEIYAHELNLTMFSPIKYTIKGYNLHLRSRNMTTQQFADFVYNIITYYKNKGVKIEEPNEKVTI